jgi:vacuolar-type H+-ATPase subunit E/Vma4
MKVDLAGRLHALALEALGGLRNETYGDLFASLTAEIPSGAWQRVRVNPLDRSLAERHFPLATIVCDPAIGGGFEVEAEEGRIRIGNTLETRLDRAWPDVLPALMRDVFEQLSDP